MFRKAIERKTYRGGTEVFVTNTVVPDMPADWALEIASRWGAVAGHPDGEDSTGRAKLRLMTPDEIVTRSCEVASKLWDEFKRRDWLLDLPTPKEEQEDDDK